MNKETTQETPLPASTIGRDASPLTQIIRSREFSVISVLILLCVGMLFTDQRSNFYSARNFQQNLLQISLLSIFAIGETIVIITGGIDLSLGSLIAFTGMLAALLTTTLDEKMFTGAAIALAVLLTLLFSFGVGAWHTALIHKVRLPPFVVTLVSLLTLRSQSYIMRHHQQIPVSATKFPLFNELANGSVTVPLTHFAIPVPALILLVVAVAAHLILSRTTIGRYLYSVGSNEQATMLSGVNIFRVKLFAYGFAALLGGVAGLLYMGYGGQGDPSAGQSYELNAVAAAVVGGASLTGGQGSVMGTVIGACLLNAILSAILLTFSQPDLWSGTVVGGVLLLAVLTTAIQQNRRQTR